MKSWRRVETWFAAQLDERSPRAALTAIALFALAGVLFLTGLKAAQDVFIDAAEAYAWGQSFLGGYGRHPPMTGWIAGVWYSVFPAADWASYALSRVMTFVTLAALYFIARRVVGPRRALLLAAGDDALPAVSHQRRALQQLPGAARAAAAAGADVSHRLRKAQRPVGCAARACGGGVHAHDLFGADRCRGDRACRIDPSRAHALPALARAVGRGDRLCRSR